MSGTKLDVEAERRLLNQVLEVWVRPEIERRGGAGTLSTNFKLESAQVIMNVGLPTTVRLNAEVRAIMLGKPTEAAKGTLQIGQPVYWDQLAEIGEVLLTSDDADAGHITLVIRPDGMALLTFDCRYNAGRARVSVEAAREFWEASQRSGTPQALAIVLREPLCGRRAHCEGPVAASAGREVTCGANTRHHLEQDQHASAPRKRRSRVRRYLQ